MGALQQTSHRSAKIDPTAVQKFSPSRKLAANFVFYDLKQPNQAPCLTMLTILLQLARNTEIKILGRILTQLASNPRLGVTLRLKVQIL
jgi:hypothetical protein